MASMTLEDALRDLEFLFAPERYPSYKESWRIVCEYALDGQLYRQSKGAAGSTAAVGKESVPQSDTGR